MKSTLYFILILNFLSCHPGTELEKMENKYPHKDRFIVSENNRRLDNLRIENEKNGMNAYFIRRMNENELEAIEKFKN